MALTETSNNKGLFNLLRSRRRSFDSRQIAALLKRVNKIRTKSLAGALATYIQENLPAAIAKRETLAEYRINPYVLMTSAAVANLSDPDRLAQFLFGSKLYMGLETSFGKSVESAFLSPYPLESKEKWSDAPEKLAESALLLGIGREDKAQQRLDSVWREIDKSVVLEHRRYLVSIKSGPRNINDTQVQAMTRAILDHHGEWFDKTRKNFPDVQQMDIVIGLTYGTDLISNNKENQILAKLLQRGFREEDREKKPGVLIDEKTASVRVYRVIGQDFWSFIGNPAKPETAEFVFLEVLLALAKALSEKKTLTLEQQINAKMRSLAAALARLTFPDRALPDWVKKGFSKDALFWFATAVSAFYDDGI